MPVSTAGTPSRLNGPIQDLRVRAVIDRLNVARPRPIDGGPRRHLNRDPSAWAEYGFSIAAEQGDLIYLLCRAMGARRVVEFATSVGMSTLYFAAAMRDNGGGTLIGTELVPAKVEAARRNLAEAGLDAYAEIPQGDARTTLRDLSGSVDFILIDGWPKAGAPSLAREVIEITAPRLRVGGYVMNDNGEPDFIDFIRDPANGLLAISLPLKGGTELAVKVN